MNNYDENIAQIELLTKYFSEEASIEERQQLEVWKDSSPEYLKEFEAFQKLWNITGSSTHVFDIDVDSEWKTLEKNIESGTKTIHLFQRALKIAASILIISTIAFWSFKQFRTTSEQSTIAETKNITLPDGTVISLNAGSKIAYNKGFGTSHRNITLKGEAYFEVEKNAELPFVIKANEVSIKVIGTKFNVKAYKQQSEVKVMVTQGKIQLYETRKPTNKAVLTAGESGSFIREIKKIEKLQESNANDIAWKTLVLDFSNTSMNEVAAVISNTYHIDLQVAPSVGNCPITVKFEQQDLSSVLKILTSTLNLTVSRSKDNKTLLINGVGCD